MPTRARYRRDRVSKTCLWRGQR